MSRTYVEGAQFNSAVREFGTQIWLHLSARHCSRVTILMMALHCISFKLLSDISAFDLRHVVYDIPTEYTSPFVTLGVEVGRAASKLDEALQSFG